MTRYEPGWLLFASDADLLMLWGGACLLVAVLAVFLDRRRHNRDRLAAADRVGVMPWTLIFLISAMLGFGLVAVALAG